MRLLIFSFFLINHFLLQDQHVNAKTSKSISRGEGFSKHID